MSQKNDTSKLFMLPLIMAGIFFISIADLPYAFYIVMRIVIPMLSIIFLLYLVFLNDGFSLMLIPNILIVILWNPFLPVYMDKESWVVIDVIAGISQIIMSFYTYRICKDYE